MAIAAIAVAVISIGIRRRALLVLLTVISLAVIAYFAVAFPSARNEDLKAEEPRMAKLGFWGSETVSAPFVGEAPVEISLSYRPNWGWFLGLVAFVVALVGVAVVRSPKAAAPVTPT